MADTDFSHVKSVAVLGAGVAGLQVADRLARSGLACTVFEKADEVGGVWRSNYAGFGLQVPKELFEFPGYPFAAPHGSFLRSFARDRGLYDWSGSAPPW